MSNKKRIKILFVCMGNICRSPTAHALFQQQVARANLEDHFLVDSAGTHAYHVGHAPDARATETGLSRGVDMRRQRARQVTPLDLKAFDYVLAMDRHNLDILQNMQAEHGGTAKLSLLLDYAAGASVSEVPDPYYGGPGGFERVFDLVESGCQGLLNVVSRPLKPD